MIGYCYCTREQVKRALDHAESARNDVLVDRAARAATETIEGTTHRQFVPTTAVRSFRWPAVIPSASYRLWLDGCDLISATAVVAGGVTIDAGDYLLEPVNFGPPYTRIEIDLSSSAALSAGATAQRAIAITGVWGYSASTLAAGALAEALDITETAVDVTDSAEAGIGDVIAVDSERMLVVGKAMLSTGVAIDVGDALTASAADVGITASALPGIPIVGETIAVDSERMLVVDVAGLLVTVRRAWDGTALAAHAGGAAIYAPRTLTVTRGALGTTATTHLSAAAVTRHVVPGLINTWAIAEAMDTLLQEGSGYARTAGTGDAAREYGGTALKDLRERGYNTYGRKFRKGVV